MNQAMPPAGSTPNRSADFESGDAQPDPSSTGPFATFPVLLIGLAAAALTLAAGIRYGYHRDELYYLATGGRLDWGYVDQPPGVPFLAHIIDVIGLQTLVSLRIAAGLLAGATVTMTALLARELGGRRTAQIMAAFAATAAPLVRIHASFFGTTPFDMLAWVTVLFLTARLLRTQNPRWWLALGLAIGVAFELKATMALLALGLAAGFLTTSSRRLIWSWWAAAGGAVALAVWAPNVIWNATNGWALIEWSRNKGNNGLTFDASGALFAVFALVIEAGITTVVLWWPGLRWLASGHRLHRRFVPLIVIAATATGAVLVSGAKYYYATPLFLLLFAAGAVAVEAMPAAQQRLVIGFVALAFVISVPATLPILPAGSLGAINTLNRDYESMVGWPELSQQVSAVVSDVAATESAPPVLTGNYGEASALRRYASNLAVYSGHNNYWLWGPPPDAAKTVVIVGYSQRNAAKLCGSLERAGTVANDAGLANGEAGVPIWICRNPTRPWSQAWPDLKDFS